MRTRTITTLETAQELVDLAKKNLAKPSTEPRIRGTLVFEGDDEASLQADEIKWSGSQADLLKLVFAELGLEIHIT